MAQSGIKDLINSLDKRYERNRTPVMDAIIDSVTRNDSHQVVSVTARIQGQPGVPVLMGANMTSVSTGQMFAAENLGTSAAPLWSVRGGAIGGNVAAPRVIEFGEDTGSGNGGAGYSGGDLLLGLDTNSNPNFFFDESAGTFVGRMGTVETLGLLPSQSAVFVGDQTKPHVWIDPNGIDMFQDATTKRVHIGTDGSGWFVASDKIWWETNGTLHVTGVEATKIVVTDGVNSLWLNDANDGGLAIGGMVKASAPFRVTAAGVLTASGVNISGTISATGGTFSGLLQVGTGTPHIHLDGANALLESSNFSSSVAGWRIASDGSAEFENLTARGFIKTAVFQKSLVTAFAGSQMVSKSASVLNANATLTGTTFTINVKPQADTAPFSDGDLIHIKGETISVYAKVGAPGVLTSGGYPYTATWQYGSNSGTVNSGETVVDYGPSGFGRIFMTADDTNAPFFSIATHDFPAVGNIPVWTEYVRIGNLKGKSGYAADAYGMFIGDGTNYFLKYDPTGGLQIKGSITITGGNAATTTNVSDAQAAAVASANSYTDTGLAGKTKTFYQNAIPTSVAIGDLWFDTDDGNKPYRAASAGATTIASGKWELVQDTVAAGKTTTFYQTSAPSATAIGDLWIDSDDGNKLYRASATGTGNWVSIQDTNKTKTFYQTSIPTSTAIGDLWFDSDDSNKCYRAAAVGATTIAAGQWVLAQDLTTKGTTFYQASIPTSLKAGDLWIDSDDSYKLYSAYAAGVNTIGATGWVLVQDAATAAKTATDYVSSTGKLVLTGNTPAVAGLYMDSTHLGYNDGSGANGWKAYISSAGYFYFGGPTGAHLEWNGTKLRGLDSGGAEQWYAQASDGKLYAAGGNLQIDTQGIKLTGGQSAVAFMDGAFETGRLFISQYNDNLGRSINDVTLSRCKYNGESLTNGSFETDESGWTFAQSGSLTWTRTRSNASAHSGTYSEALTPGGAATAGYYKMTTNSVSVSAGQKVRFSFWQRSTMVFASGSKVNVNLDFFNSGGGGLSGSVRMVKPATTWGQIVFDVDAPANAASCKASITYDHDYEVDTATLYIDDVSLLTAQEDPTELRLTSTGITAVVSSSGSFTVAPKGGGGITVDSTGGITYDGDLKPIRNGTAYTSYTFVPLATRYDVLTNVTRSVASATTETITLSNSIIPAAAKAVSFTLIWKGSSANENNYYALGWSNTGNERYVSIIYSISASVRSATCGVIPVASNGTNALMYGTYMTDNGSGGQGSGTLNIMINGYFI